MNLPDIINCLFETSGSAFIFMSIIKLHKDKVVHGVSYMTTCFFSAWGFWNLFYYPHLEQWASFYGGLLIVLTNTIWTGQIIYYTRRNATTFK